MSDDFDIQIGDPSMEVSTEELERAYPLIAIRAYKRALDLFKKELVEGEIERAKILDGRLEELPAERLGQVLASSFLKKMDAAKAPNCMELDYRDQQDARILVTIRRSEGKGPLELLQEAKARVAELERLGRDLVDQIEECGFVDTEGHNIEMNAMYLALREALPPLEDRKDG